MGIAASAADLLYSHSFTLAAPVAAYAAAAAAAASASASYDADNANSENTEPAASAAEYAADAAGYAADIATHAFAAQSADASIIVEHGVSAIVLEPLWPLHKPRGQILKNWFDLRVRLLAAD